MFQNQLDPTARRLILIRGLRSLGQGAMVVDLTLYLSDLHWSGAAIGSVTSAAGLFGAALILLVGILSDRIGRKPFLFIYEIMTFFAAIAASITTHAIVLVFAIVVAGFGRGQSGAAGPFSPAEQAWLARHVENRNRGMVFSINNAAGFIGMAAGSIIGGIPAYLISAGPLAAYRPVFLMVAFFSLFCIIILAGMKEEPAETAAVRPQEASKGTPPVAATKVPAGTPTEPIIEIAAKTGDETTGEMQSGEGTLNNFENNGSYTADCDNDEHRVRKQENTALLKLGLINVLNGLAVGLTGPMMAYWFSIRYGVSAADVSITLSISFLLSGIFSVFNGFLARRMGMVKSVTWMRILGSALMLTLPWMPTFTAASVIYVFRIAVNRGTTGNRFALGVSLTRDRRRGLATSVNALSMRLPSSIGPTITGYLFDMGNLYLPLILTAVLQLANAGIYQRVFGGYDKKGAVLPKTEAAP